MAKNELMVKDVDFLGDTLKAARDEKGIVWAGIPWICKGMGMTKDQIGYERKKIQDDLVLNQGVKFHPLGTGNANKEVLCLQLDYVPLWLAKISITPKMRESNPELVEKLITYQLKAKDALAAAFLPAENKQSPAPERIPIRLYKNNKWYILTIGDELYSLAPDEAKIIDKVVHAMTTNGATQVVEVVKTIIDEFNRDCRLKCVRHCTVKASETALEKKDPGKGGATE